MLVLALCNGFRQSYSQATLVGLDTGYFAHCLTNAHILPECRADIQYFADVRRLPREAMQNVDAIVHLAAISNDPMGNTFEEVTFAINHHASVELAKEAKKAGVKTFIFAASCSMYGLAMTAQKGRLYAKSSHGLCEIQGLY